MDCIKECDFSLFLSFVQAAAFAGVFVWDYFENDPSYPQEQPVQMLDLPPATGS